MLCEQCDVGKSATVRGCTPEVNFFSEFTVRAGEKGHIGCHSFGPPCSRGVSKVWNYFGRKGDSAAIFLWMAIDLSHVGYETSLMSLHLEAAGNTTRN